MGLVEFAVTTGLHLGFNAVYQAVMSNVAPAPGSVDLLDQYLEGKAAALAHYEEALRLQTPVQRPTLTSSSGPIARPGCTAADEAIVALGHLEGLARGNQGFGVLRVSKERLEKAASAADGLNHPEIAAGMRTVAEKMPDVHTPEAAHALADELRPVVDSAWPLGQRCKGTFSPQDIARMREMAEKMAAKRD